MRGTGAVSGAEAGANLEGLGSGTWGRKDACRKILSARLPTESNSALAAAVSHLNDYFRKPNAMKCIAYRVSVRKTEGRLVASPQTVVDAPACGVVDIPPVGT